MPFHQRSSYALSFVLMVFGGFALLFAAWFAVAMAIDPAHAEPEKLTTGEMVMVLALLMCFLGMIAASGALASAVVFSAVPTSRRYWLLAALAGAINALVLLTAVYVTDLIVIEAESCIGVAVGGLLSGVLVRQVGLLLGWARPWYPPGMCERCGYDLRKTPAGSPCPECGAIVPEAR
ncbi:MAG: hypothetical protein AAF711_07425 [Planctomycetota bacterium]